MLRIKTMGTQQTQEGQVANCSKEAILANLEARLQAVEKRVEHRDVTISILEAWQNKALGYVMALSAIATVVLNRVI